MTSLKIVQLLILWLLILSQSQSSAGAANTVDAIELKQTHYYFGKLTTTVCKQGVRLECSDGARFTLVAKAPDWKVTVFRNDDKVFHCTALKEFEDTGLVSQMIVAKKPESEEGTGHVGQFTVSGVKSLRLTTPTMNFEYLPPQKLIVPQVEAILYAALRLPTNGGVPVRYVQIMREGHDWITGLDERGYDHVRLITKSIVPVKVAQERFLAPAGYKQSRSMQEVLVGSQGRSESAALQDLFEINNKPRH